MARVAGLRVAVVSRAGDLGGIEGHRLRHRHTLRAIQRVRAFFLNAPPVAAGVGGADSVGHGLHQRRTAPSSILAGIEAFAAQAVRHIRSFVVAVQRRRHVGTDFGTGLTRGYADGSNWNHVTCCGMVCAV